MRAVNGRESRKVRVLDVRALMAEGGKPLPKILRAIAALGPDEALMLITPFLPAPLIERLHSEGFSARPEPRGDGSWQTCFQRE
jgi:hypothetical protein